MKNSKIQWTDHTFNPWRGCTKVSPGCAHCYAETLSKRNPKLLGEWGPGKPRVRASAKMWNEPIKWNRLQQESGAVHHGATRPRVFCASLADWLDDEVPIEWLADLLHLIHCTPNLDWLLLTKRPQNWQHQLIHAVGQMTVDYWVYEWIGGKAPANVWIGTTVEDQARADERLLHLLKIPAYVRFLSCEPLLGPVEIPFFGTLPEIDFPGGYRTCAQEIHWVICGGESGHGARPMHPDWARSLRDQCEAAQVPFFFKQWGEWLPYNMGNAYMDGFQEAQRLANGPGATGWPVYKVGKAAAGRLLDGREWNEFPSL